MTDTKTKPIHVPTPTHTKVKLYAVDNGKEIGEATAELVDYALDRKAALAKYEEKRATKKAKR